MDDLYREEILDHYNNPRHFQKKLPQTNLKKGVITTDQTNANCGDVISLSLHITLDQKTQQIKDIQFSGHGCAISIAFTSLLIEKIIASQLSLKQLKKLTENDLVKMVGGTSVSPARQKCLRLGIKALLQAVKKSQKSSTKSISTHLL